MKHGLIKQIGVASGKAVARALLVAGAFHASTAHAVVGSSTASNGLDLANAPLYVTSNVSPIVMLNVTKDHQLYYRAYNDYTDLDNDGVMDTTYKHSFNYYGYFDYGKCYRYDTSGGYYFPVSVTTDKYCTAGDNQWSGNFLNWIAMTRIDVLRKVLYGGTRATDTSSLTVLERSFLPTDAHAWVKYYNGSDLNRLSPFTQSSAMTTTFSVNGSNQPAVYAPGSNGERSIDVYMTTSNIDAQIGDQVTVSSPSGTRRWVGMITYVESGRFTLRVPSNGMTGTADGNENGSWSATNHTRAGVSFCNVTYANDVQSQSVDTATNPPLIRAVRGDYSLWAANERQQCLYAEERGDTLTTIPEGKNNGNRRSLSGLNASAKNPPYARGLYSVLSTTKPDYFARVKVCVAGLIGNENCKAYGTASPVLKPIGLLQEFGEGTSPAMRFGLFTGSYNKNISGGVLRRAAMESLSKASYAENEISPTDGTLTSVVGIIRTLDRLRMYGYQFGSSDGYMSADSCNYQQMGMVSSGGGGSGLPANEGNCSTWGNPMGELYLESLRYLAGKTTPSTGFVATGGKDAALGLPIQTTWSDPVTTGAYCTPLTALVFNSSSVSYDEGQYDSVIDIGEPSALASLTSLDTKTDAIGAAELANSNVLIGSNGTDTNGECTSKAFTTLKALQGICPEAPSLKGTFKLAGLAYLARTQRIRTVTGIPSTDTTSLKVQTYGVQLASSIPVIKVNAGGRQVTITPTYRLRRNNTNGTGTLVDFRPVGTPTATTGVYYIAWEDSNQGGDYDQDVWGLLSYTVSGNDVIVRTKVVAYATNNPQGFGYSIEGTDKDGVHFFSGIENFDYDDPTQMLSRLTFDDGTSPVSGTDQVNSTGGCRQCTVAGKAINARFTATGTASSPLKDPLYYAAKWGGFVSDTGAVESANDTPNTAGRSWDIYNNLSGDSGADGQPDNYFYVINPMQLQDALRRAFIRIMTEGSSSGVAANAYSVSTDTMLFFGGFNTRFWSGWLKAIRLNADGSINPSSAWNTDSTMSNINAANRVVMTRGASAAIPFRWDQISSAQQNILEGSDSLGEERLNFLRGSEADEGSLFRRRSGSKLGDVVNSSPIFVGRPTGRYNYPINQFNEVYTTDATYQTWRSDTARANRTKMVYVGANDGMLHGFNADTGQEKLAYIPGAVFSKLNALTSATYQHQYTVDGAVTVADVKFASTAGTAAPAGWNTVLVGALGAGGRGVYALNVTNPNFSEATAANVGMWEFTNTDDPDLGYTLSAPMIVKMNNGRWMAVFGNGYVKTGDNINTGRAKLFLLDIERGADGTWAAGDYMTIDTEVGTASSPNGLGNLAAIDTDLNGTPDYIYAGDLQGNMWKFDVSNSNSNSWGVAYRSGSTPLPLITVCNDPSSTANCNASRVSLVLPPTISYHPNSYNSYMVYFGSGRYLANGDQTATSRGSVYGVWDNGAALGNLGGIPASQQVVQTVSQSGNTRLVTNLPIDWSVHKLWRTQLPTTGERMSGAPTLFNGVLLYTTYIPSSAVCSQQGSGWIMGVNFENGGQVTFNLFDTNNSGSVTTADTSAAGLYMPNPTLGGTVIVRNPGSGSAGSATLYTSPTSGGGTGGPGERTPIDTPWTSRRVSWREMFRE